MSDYEKQAQAFLDKTRVKMTVKFLKHGKHFEDEKESRDIFKVEFKRMVRGFSVSFGQSINNSTGSGDNVPTAYDVLTCLQKSDPGTFAEFCADCGYSDDSIKATKIYKAVCKEWEGVQRIWSEKEIEELQDIQ